jgi:DNA ligase-1
MKYHLVMLAHNYDPAKFQIAGSFVSEKLDGFRCWWDGGITKGMPKSDIPWANKYDTNKLNQISTGLWSRYGNIIHAPDSWVNQLPNVMLDGEIWAGRGSFQKCRSVCSRIPENQVDWTGITYNVFDLVDKQALKGRKIKCPQLNIEFEDAYDLAKSIYVPSGKGFRSAQAYLKNKVEFNETLILHPQKQLSYNVEDATATIDQFMHEVVNAGGEGLMLRRPDSSWVPIRSKELVKVKPCNDSEATVINYRAAKSGKLSGMIGSLIVDWNGVVFELSGLDHSERVLGKPNEMMSNGITDIMADPKSFRWCEAHPGELVPKEFESIILPRGCQVSFKYKDLTDSNVPKEARFWRK